MVDPVFVCLFVFCWGGGGPMPQCRANSEKVAGLGDSDTCWGGGGGGGSNTFFFF